MTAAYVFRVWFRLDPEAAWVEPNEFETVLRIPAQPPGEPGWRFFEYNLWRGQVGDETHLKDVASDYLGVPVSALSFRELDTDETYLEKLKQAIAADLTPFNADSAETVLNNHLGSSIHVQ